MPAVREFDRPADRFLILFTNSSQAASIAGERRSCGTRLTSADLDDELAAGVASLGLLQRRQCLVEGVDVMQHQTDPTGRDVAHELVQLLARIGTMGELLDPDPRRGGQGSPETVTR